MSRRAANTQSSDTNRGVLTREDVGVPDVVRERCARILDSMLGQRGCSNARRAECCCVQLGEQGRRGRRGRQGIEQEADDGCNQTCDAVERQVSSRTYALRHCPRRGTVLVLFLNLVLPDSNDCAESPGAQSQNASSASRLRGGGGGGGAMSILTSILDTVRFDGQTIGKKHARLLVNLAREHEARHLVLVVEREVTPPTKLALDSSFVSWETFTYCELTVDISRHELIPPHKLVLSKRTRRRIVRRYCGRQHLWNGNASDETLALTDAQRMADCVCTRESCWCLPRIFIDDPMARYLNVGVGEIIRIHRYSTTNGRSIAYRIGSNHDQSY